MSHTARRAATLLAVGAPVGWLTWRGPLAAPLAHGGLAPRTRAVVDAEGVVVAVFGLVRIAVLAGCAALLLLGALHLAAAWSGARPLHALACGLTPRALRPFLGLVTVATLAAPIGAGASTPPTIVAVTTTSSPPPTMQRTATIEVAPTTTVLDVAVVSPVHPKPPLAPLEPVEPVEPVAEMDTWTVAVGEHLWFVAEQVTSHALGRPAAEREIAPYWRALVEANRDRLVDPANPDLVHAGQELVLPAHPAMRRS